MCVDIHIGVHLGHFKMLEGAITKQKLCGFILYVQPSGMKNTGFETALIITKALAVTDWQTITYRGTEIISWF